MLQFKSQSDLQQLPPDDPAYALVADLVQRMIAFSPVTDVVHKYWYKSGGSNQFKLVDESVNVMTYQRIR